MTVEESSTTVGDPPKQEKQKSSTSMIDNDESSRYPGPVAMNDAAPSSVVGSSPNSPNTRQGALQPPVESHIDPDATTKDASINSLGSPAKNDVPPDSSNGGHFVVTNATDDPDFEDDNDVAPSLVAEASAQQEDGDDRVVAESNSGEEKPQSLQLPSKQDRLHFYQLMEQCVNGRIRDLRNLPDTRPRDWRGRTLKEFPEPSTVALRGRQVQYYPQEALPLVAASLLLRAEDLQNLPSPSADHRVDDVIACVTLLLSNVIFLSKGQYDARVRSVIKAVCIQLLFQHYQVLSCKDETKQQPDAATLRKAPSKALYFMTKEIKEVKNLDVENFSKQQRLLRQQQRRQGLRLFDLSRLRKGRRQENYVDSTTEKQESVTDSEEDDEDAVRRRDEELGITGSNSSLEESNENATTTSSLDLKKPSVASSNLDDGDDGDERHVSKKEGSQVDKDEKMENHESNEVAQEEGSYKEGNQVQSDKQEGDANKQAADEKGPQFDNQEQNGKDEALFGEQVISENASPEQDGEDDKDTSQLKQSESVESEASSAPNGEMDEKIINNSAVLLPQSAMTLARERFEAMEKAIATDILHVLVQKEQEQAARHDALIPHNPNAPKFNGKQLLMRTLKIGGVSLFVGGLFAVTGGLAAPGLVAAMSAFGVVSAIPAFATLTTTAALASMFGVVGGGLAAYKMKKRTQGLSEWRIRKELNPNSNRVKGLHATVCVSGWLDSRQDFQHPFGVQASDPPSTEILDLLQRFFTVHNPSKIPNCKLILKVFKNNEDELWAKIKKKYGDDPQHLLPFDKSKDEDVLEQSTLDTMDLFLKSRVLQQAKEMEEIYQANMMLVRMEMMNAENYCHMTMDTLEAMQGSSSEKSEYQDNWYDDVVLEDDQQWESDSNGEEEVDKKESKSDDKEESKNGKEDDSALNGNTAGDDMRLTKPKMDVDNKAEETRPQSDSTKDDAAGVAKAADEGTDAKPIVEKVDLRKGTAKDPPSTDTNDATMYETEATNGTIQSDAVPTPDLEPTAAVESKNGGRSAIAARASLFGSDDGETDDDETADDEDDAPKPQNHTLVVWDWEAHYSGELYTITWETDFLLNLCRVVEVLFYEVSNQVSKEILKQTIIGGMVAAVAIPSALTTATGVIDDPYQIISLRAEKAGIELAHCLLLSEEGRPVTLVGYSFGARVIFCCLLELFRHQRLWEEKQKPESLKEEEEQSNASAGGSTRNLGKNLEKQVKRWRRKKEVVTEYRREPASLVEDVVFVGLPRLVDQKEWIAIRELVAGRLINCYNKNDWILSYMINLRCWNGVSKTCGTHPVPLAENYEISHLASSHARYPISMPQILHHVAFGEPTGRVVDGNATMNGN